MSHINRIQWIKDQLLETFSPIFLSIKDDSDKHAGHEGAKGGGGHYTLEIWSAQFEKRSSLDCHRMIYQALGSAIPHEIHALKIKLKRPN